MSTTMPTAPSLTELANAQRNGFVFANNQNEEQLLLDRKRAVYALKVAERENFLHFCEENTVFNVVLRSADGRELSVGLSTQAIGVIYGTIHEDLSEALRERESVIIEELLRMETDAVVSATKDGPVLDTYESAILTLCMPATTGATASITEAPPLPAGQRLFMTPPTKSGTALAAH